MAFSLNRRYFLATCVASALYGATKPIFAYATKKPLYAYISESFGPYGGAPLFALGLLLTADPERHISALHEIKKRMGYHRKLRFHSGDRRKVGVAREFIHYFTHDPELRFTGDMVNLAHRVRAKQFFEARINHYPTFLQQAALPEAPVLRLRRFPRVAGPNPKFGHKFNPDFEFHCRVDPLVSQHLITRAEPVVGKGRDGLAELANLLTGSLYQDGSQAAGNIPSREVNIQIVKRLRSLLDVRLLTEPVGDKWRPKIIKAA
jgi:hypothetical protein